MCVNSTTTAPNGGETYPDCHPQANAQPMTLREAARQALRDERARLGDAELERMYADAPTLADLLRSRWGVEGVEIRTCPALIDGLLVRIGRDLSGTQQPEVALRCRWCDRPRWSLAADLPAVGRLLENPALGPYEHLCDDPRTLLNNARAACTCVDTVAPDGAWLPIGQSIRWAWVPRNTIVNVHVGDDGSLTIATTREVYPVQAILAPTVLAALGIPEPPTSEDGGA